MTERYWIAIKAEDLKVGDMFSHWAKTDDDLCPKASRINSIAELKDSRNVILEDGREMSLGNGMAVVIQDYA